MQYSRTAIMGAIHTSFNCKAGMLRPKKTVSKAAITMCKQATNLPRVRSCDLRNLIANVALQLTCTCILLVLLHSLRGRIIRERDLHISTMPCQQKEMEPTSPFLSTDAKTLDQQISFLQDQGSSLATANHSFHKNSTPTWWTLEAKSLPVEEFCKKIKKQPIGGRGFKYAAYTDVILVNRKLYLPASLDCSKIPDRKPLHTKFNSGQRSTPLIPVVVVPSIPSFEDFSPRAFCHETVFEPSLLLSFINWPQYGHFMFNGISLLWEIFDDTLATAGKNVRLYAYGDSLDKSKRLSMQESAPFFDLLGFEPLAEMFSYQPVRSLGFLLKQSEHHPICFSFLLTGLSGSLDHYNFAAPLEKWREFAMAVRAHFQAPESLRLSGENVETLSRFASADALRGSPVLNKPILPFDFEALPDRPRLTIIDRKSNRKIINVENLRQAAFDSNLFKEVEVIYLEEMDISSQIRLMTVTDVLFGMDGTGLMNGIFLPEGGVVVHVRPYGCARALREKGLNFDRLWMANPGRVIRYESDDRNSTRFPTGIHEVAEKAFNLSSPANYRAPFILKQDTIIDLVAFRCILEDAHRLLRGVSVDWEKHKACTQTVFW